MFKLAGSVFAVLCLAAPMASAETAPKPVVCLQWDVVQGKAGPYAVCVDGKKPFVMRTAKEVTIEDAEGRPVRVLVGFR